MRSPARTAPRRPGTTGLLSLLAAFLFAWLFRGLLVGECLLQADLEQLIEPLRQVAAQAAREGGLSWTSALGNGSPLLGNPLHALAYPPNWLCFLMEPAFALSLLCALHLAWGAVGTWLLAHERGAGGAEAWTAAAAFALCGVSLSAALMPNLGWTLAWLPWLLFAHGRLRRRPRSTWPVLGLALILAFLLVIAEPTLLFAGLFWLAIAELRVLLRSRGRVLPWRSLAAGLLGLALALPAIWPVMRTVGESVRSAGFKQEGMLQWSLHPLETLAFTAPGLLGDPRLYGLEGHWAKKLWPERESGFYHGTYWGGLVLCLAVAGAFAPGRRRTELLAWLGLLTLLALGSHGPIFPWLSQVPLADSWRYPLKWLTPISLPVALLAARGLRSLPRPAPRRAMIAMLSVLLLACVGLAVGASFGLADAAWALLGSGGEAPAWLAARLGNAGWRGALPLLLGAALLARRSQGGSGRWFAPAVAALITLELLVANSVLLPSVPLSAYRAVPAPVAVLRAQEPPVERLWVEPATDLRWASVPRTRAEYHRWERDSLRLYTAASFGLPLAFHVDFEAMAPLDYALLSRMIATAPDREKLMLLGASGVSHLASFEDHDPRWTEEISRHEVSTQRPLRLFRNRLAMPRARVVGRLLLYSSRDELYRSLASAPDELFASSAIVARDDLPDGPALFVGAVSSVALLRDSGDELLLACEGGGGFLIVSDPLVGGWTASIDGVPASMFRADVAFRGLALPPGEHQVRMSFKAW